MLSVGFSFKRDGFGQRPCRMKYARDIESARLGRVSSLVASESEVEEECLEMEDHPDEWWRELQDGNYAKALAPKALKPRKPELTPKAPHLANMSVQ